MIALREWLGGSYPELDPFDIARVEGLKRCVRDNCGIFKPGNVLMTIYDYPWIEEVLALASSERQDVVLLIRNCYDYHKRGIFQEVTYSTDINDLQLPPDPDKSEYWLYSEACTGTKFFTANMRCFYNGAVNLLKEELTGEGTDCKVEQRQVTEISMHHMLAQLQEMLRYHLFRAQGYDLRDDPLLFQRAIATLDEIMQKSPHIV